MDDLENKLGKLLEDPATMEKVMALAQSLGNAIPQADSPIPEVGIPDLDISALRKLTGLAGQTGIDKNQQNLLRALEPYLNQARVSKLERAMRAAKMAKIATAFLGTQGNGR